MSAELNGNLTPEEQLTGALDTSAQLVGSLNTGSGGGGTDDYNDLSNKPKINNVTLSGNKTTSDLHISYNDLENKPTIPAAQVNSDWNSVSGVSEILNKPTIPTELGDLSDINLYNLNDGDAIKYINSELGWCNVPFPGSLNNLNDVNTLSISDGYTLVWDDTLQVWYAQPYDYNNLVHKPTIPDELSELTDTNISSPADGQYLKYDSTSSKWVNASGGSGGASALTDLNDTSITTPTGGQVLKYDATSSKWVNVYLSYNNLVDKPTLATVATSGSYNDLNDKPTIPKADDYNSTPEIVGTWSDGTNTYNVYRKTVFLSSPVTCSAGNTSAAGSWTSVQSGWNNTTIVLDFEAFSYSGNDKTYLGHLSAQWSNTNKDIRVLNIRSVQASIDAFRITYVEP